MGKKRTYEGGNGMTYKETREIAQSSARMEKLAGEIERLVKESKAASSWRPFYGLRVDDRAVGPGEYFPLSRAWDGDEPTGGRLRGTSTTGIDDGDDGLRIVEALKGILEYYSFSHLYLVAGMGAQGEDDGSTLLISGYDGWGYPIGAKCVACLDDLTKDVLENF